MHFPNDSLAELETPTRIFRTHGGSNAQFNRPKVASPLLDSLFIRKREMMELDEAPHHASRLKSEFFGEEIKKQHEARLAGTDASLPADRKLFEALLPLRSVQSDETRNAKFKKVKLPAKSPEVFIEPKTNAVTPNDESVQQFNSPTQKTARLNGKENPVKSPTSKPIDISESSKYTRMIQQRRQGDATMLNRRQTTLGTGERGQLRSRVTKINAFWRGESTFIPSAFRLLQLRREPKRTVVELQDFSMKGLCHVSEGFANEDEEEDMAKHLDSLGDETLCESYEMTNRQINY